MPAPVYLSVWFPGMDRPHHLGRDLVVFVRSSPHADQIDWDVHVEPKLEGVTIKKETRKGCEFTVFHISKLPLGKELELHIHATPKDTKKWLDAYHVSWIGKLRKSDTRIEKLRQYDTIVPAFPTGGTQASPVTVYPSFVAYGDIEPSTPPPSSCTLSLDGTGSPIQGSPETPPGYDWGFSFSNVGPGEYLLTVKGQTDTYTCWVQVQTP